MAEVYTVVQHSGYGYGGKPAFERGLETRNLTTKGEATRVTKAGGLVFDSYAEAEDYAFDEQYREVTHGGLTPRAPGSFAAYEVDGLRVYVPAAQ